jgi:hypothetical protein
MDCAQQRRQRNVVKPTGGKWRRGTVLIAKTLNSVVLTVIARQSLLRSLPQSDDDRAKMKNDIQNGTGWRAKFCGVGRDSGPTAAEK